MFIGIITTKPEKLKAQSEEMFTVNEGFVCE